MKPADLIKEIENKVCTNCGGLGTYNDAEPYDIYYNTYRCNDCSGTGWAREGHLEGLRVQVIPHMLPGRYLYLLYSGTHRMMVSDKHWIGEDIARRHAKAFAKKLNVKFTKKLGTTFAGERQ